MSDQPSSGVSNPPNASQPTDPGRTPPAFRGAGGQPVTVVPMGNATVNGRVLTLLFDGMRVALRRSDEPAAVRCGAASVTTDVEAPAQRVRIIHNVRGHVMKHADARVTVVAGLGGAVQTLDYPYGAEMSEPIDATFETAVELRPGQPYLVTLGIWAERRTGDADLDVTVDSIDMEIAADAPPPPGDGGGGGGPPAEQP